MTVGLGVRLGNDLMNTPGMGIDSKHPAIAVLRYEQVRVAAMVKNVQVIRSKRGRNVERFGGLLRFFLGEPNHAEPHPDGRVLRICSGLFQNGDHGFIQLIESEQSYAEKQAGATEL